jgi:hypothetical protein
MLKHHNINPFSNTIKIHDISIITESALSTSDFTTLPIISTNLKVYVPSSIVEKEIVTAASAGLG